MVRLQHRNLEGHDSPRRHPSCLTPTCLPAPLHSTQPGLGGHTHQGSPGPGRKELHTQVYSPWDPCTGSAQQGQAGPRGGQPNAPGLGLLPLGHPQKGEQVPGGAPLGGSPWVPARRSPCPLVGSRLCWGVGVSVTTAFLCPLDQCRGLPAASSSPTPPPPGKHSPAAGEGQGRSDLGPRGTGGNC